MDKIIAIIIAAVNMICVKPATAISECELMTADGNVWSVFDEVEVGKNYTLVFDSCGDNIIENDIILRIF